MLKFDATVTGDAQVAGALRTIVGKMTDLRDLYETTLEPEFYTMMERRFATEGGTERWPALSRRYAAWKARNFPGRRILEREGIMREGLTRRGGRFQVRRLDATTMELGTSARYAQHHQFGTRRMPRRKVIDFAGDDARRWQAAVEAYFEKVAKGAGT